MEDLVKNMEEYTRSRELASNVVQDLFDGDISGTDDADGDEQGRDGEASEMFLSPLSFTGSARSVVVGIIPSSCSISSGSISGEEACEEACEDARKDAREDVHEDAHEDAREDAKDDAHEDAHEDADEDCHSDGEGTIASFCSTSTADSCTLSTSDGWEGGSEGGSNACSDLDIHDDDGIYDYSQNRINVEANKGTPKPAAAAKKNRKKNDSDAADHASASYVGMQLPGCCVYYCWRF